MCAQTHRHFTKQHKCFAGEWVIHIIMVRNIFTSSSRSLNMFRSTDSH